MMLLVYISNIKLMIIHHKMFAFFHRNFQSYMQNGNEKVGKKKWHEVSVFITSESDDFAFFSFQSIKEANLQSTTY